MHIAERRLVGCKHSVDAVAFADGFFRRVPIGLVVKKVPRHHHIYHIHSVFTEHSLKNRMTVIGSHVGSHSCDVKNFSAFVFQHHFRRDLSS